VRQGCEEHWIFSFACKRGLRADWRYVDKAMGVPDCRFCLKRMPYPSPDPEDY
jgi:hypothetical protein